MKQEKFNYTELSLIVEGLHSLSVDTHQALKRGPKDPAIVRQKLDETIELRKKVEKMQGRENQNKKV